MRLQAPPQSQNDKQDEMEIKMMEKVMQMEFRKDRLERNDWAHI